MIARGLEQLSKRELISLIDLEVDRVKECEAEIARLTEENRALHGFIANWERFAGERFINNALAGASKADPQYSLSSSYCAIAKYRHRGEASR